MFQWRAFATFAMPKKTGTMCRAAESSLPDVSRGTTAQSKRSTLGLSRCPPLRIGREGPINRAGSPCDYRQKAGATKSDMPVVGTARPTGGFPEGRSVPWLINESRDLNEVRRKLSGSLQPLNMTPPKETCLPVLISFAKRRLEHERGLRLS